MAQKLKFGNGTWATKEGSTLAYNDENNNYKPLPFTTTRNSIATRVNKEGLIEVVGNDVPRIDYTDSADGVLLLENSRSNKVSTSNDFNGSGWNISNLTATANQVISPDGTLNASKLLMTGDGSLRNQSEASFNDGYAYSIFVKKGNSRYVTIRSAFFTQSFNCGFDLDNLTAETNGKIEDYGNDWYRLSITKNISGDADRSGFFYVYLPNSLGSTTSVSGNYAYFYGGQIEDGNYPTSYIPTNGSTVTRQADTANDAGNSEVFNDSEGVLFADIAALANDGTSRRISISAGNTNNNNLVSLIYGTSNKISPSIYSNGAFQMGGDYTLSDQTQKIKVALKYSLNDAALWVNGIEVLTDDVVTTPIGLDQIKFEYGNGSNDFYGKTKELGYYDTALTDEELEYLTSYRSLNELVTELNLNTL